MAADSNMGFHLGVIPSTLHNRHMLSFQSGNINSTTGMDSRGMGSSGQIVGTAGMFLFGNPSMMRNNTSAMVPAGTSYSNTHLDPVPGPKQDTGLSPEWTIEEQNILNEGLVRYAAEQNIMKYIKIAAMLRRKTVRDVALRCRWLAKHENARRRKLEEYYAGKKIRDRKEKMVVSCSKANVHMVSPDNIASYSPMMHQVNQNDRFSCEVPALDGASQQLMEENVRILSQISTNLATFKIQENIDLFRCTRNNITTILNNMSNMPSIMSQMPPLPVSVNEELLNAILPSPSQALMFGVPGIPLEQQQIRDNLL